MNYSPTLALTLLKAAGHKYTHRKLVGKDPKTGRKRYRYYYAEHHGGGITGAKFEEGSAFKLTFKGRRGHFHIDRVEGDQVFVRHDGRKGSELISLSHAELRALLERQHSKVETKSREKAQRKKRKGTKSTKSTKSTKRTAPKTAAPKIKRMSAAERKALDSDLSKALREGDADAAHELIKKDQIDYAQTGNSALDSLLSQAISAGDVETFDDATKKVSARGKLSAEQRSALEEATERGVFNSSTQGDLEVYALNSSADPDRSLTLLVKGDRFELKIDDFTPPNARDQRAIPEGEELRAPVPKQKLDKALRAIQELLKENPELASDPKIAALIGPQKPKREGRTDEMFITIDGRERKAEFKYQLIETGDAIPSHDPLSFSKREDYPEGIQERIYHQDRMEQLKVQRNAGSAYEPSYLINTNPDATNGPPIVTPDGIVLGGNSRVMSTQLVNMNNPAGRERYKEKLSQDAAIYGFSQADIDAMDSPMLVRVYEPEQTDKKHMAKLVRAMNENKTQGMDERTAGRAAAAKVSQQTLKTLQRGLDSKEYTFNRFMTKPSKALDAFKEALYKDGILNAQNTSQLIRTQDGSFTATGREFLQYMLVGYVVNDDRLLPTLDYATMEQLTVSLGKLAAAGIGETERASLQNAVAVYNNVISRDLLPQKGKDIAVKRNRAVDMVMLEEQELGLAAAGAEGSESDELSVSKIPIGELKDRVRKDPLSSAFLKILTLNPGKKGLETTVERLVKLTEDTGQASMFGGDEVLDYSEAANKIAKELASTHEIEARLYELPEKTRKGSPLLDLYKAIRC